jgi:cytochrome bd ubiquinol oxidase subunit II
MMPTFWFVMVAAMLAVYVILDGFDLGAGIVHLVVARTAEERRTVLRTIGPVWDGNEVWLLAAGGTLYFAFPSLYASSFSGFYLPLMIVLWLLILRGIAIEFRNHIESAVWQPLWDVVFSASSALLAVFFGAALGNVIRGVPLDSEGYFFLPLWTDFRAGAEAGILDWYTLLVAASAFLVLAVHGALWVALKTEGELERRARRFAHTAWWAAAAGVIVITAASFQIQPQLSHNFDAHPWGYGFPLLALAGLAGARLLGGLRAFLGSSLAIGGLLASAAFGIFPYVLPSNNAAAPGLTIANTAAPAYGLGWAVVWFVPGMLLTTGYFVYTYRNFSGKVK